MHDSAKGSAWPLLVGEVICLLNCVNERDLCQLLDARVVVGGRPADSSEEAALSVPRRGTFTYWDYAASNCIETRAQSRSVMLLYVLGCTRTTLIQPTSFCHSVSHLWQPGPKGLGNLLSLSRAGD